MIIYENELLLMRLNVREISFSSSCPYTQCLRKLRRVVLLFWDWSRGDHLFAGGHARRGKRKNLS